MKETIIKYLKSSFQICTILGVVMFLVYLAMGNRDMVQLFKISMLYSYFYGMPLSIVNGVFFNRIDIVFPWSQKPKQRLWLGNLGAIFFTMMTLFVLNFILWVCIWGADFSSLFSERNVVFYIISLVITVVISSILHAKHFYRVANEQILISETLRKEKLTTELNALKAHIDPHFLFNSFNILYAMIDESPKHAQKLLKQLSDIYRYILDHSDDHETTLKKELQFAQKYINLMQARFENSIQINFDISHQYQSQKIPTLSLQLLLENAIKHNAFDEIKKLIINIYVDDHALIVENNKCMRKNLTKGTKLGLQNIKDRYQLLGAEEMQIIDKNDYFTVKLPFI